jgi:hypothetical protein
MTQDGHPFRDLAGRLGKDFTLSNKLNLINTFVKIDSEDETNKLKMSCVRSPFREDFSERRS